MSWDKDWEGWLTKHHNGQNSLESEILTEFMLTKSDKDNEK